MSHTVPEAFFLDAANGGGQRFALYHTPHQACRGRILYLHPLAEEMNKARRMAALQARHCAVAGYAVLQLDLLGCGDSSGDFSDASWEDWLADGQLGLQWLAERHSEAPAWLWGLRSGALLASQLAARLHGSTGRSPDLLLWQPVIQGRQALQQFLRLRLAAELRGDGKAIMEQLKSTLDRGEAVEVAGYRLSAALAQGLGAAQLQAPPAGCRLQWLEVSTREPAELLPVSQGTVESWRTAGHAVQARVVTGPAFWQSTEIETAPALLDACLAALRGEP